MHRFKCFVVYKGDSSDQTTKPTKQTLVLDLAQNRKNESLHKLVHYEIHQEINIFANCRALNNGQNVATSIFRRHFFYNSWVPCFVEGREE